MVPCVVCNPGLKCLAVHLTVRFIFNICIFYNFFLSKIQSFVKKIMCSFEIEVTFLKHFLKSYLYLATLTKFYHIGSIFKSDCLFSFTRQSSGSRDLVLICLAGASV